MAAFPESGAAAPAARVGWDIGGAHVKACLLEAGRVVDVAQWPCPLWQGLEHLDAVLALARARWPRAWDATACHAATMTGEMVDLFAHREDGVARLAAHLAEGLGPSLRLYAGAAGWHAPQHAGRHWRAIASANWHATAELLATRVEDALLLDIGSTTTDLIPVRGSTVAARGANDARRLATGELLYQGVVRTPLCALAPRVAFDGELVNVMNEFFATTADVYRLTGQLAPAHDQSPTADGADRSLQATRRRLARMVGRDARDHADAQWLALAEVWRDEQLREMAALARAVADAAGLSADAPVVGAGCGAFLAAAVAARIGRPFRRFAEVAGGAAAAAGRAASSSTLADDALPPSLAGWFDVCAPAVAVALLATGGD